MAPGRSQLWSRGGKGGGRNGGGGGGGDGSDREEEQKPEVMEDSSDTLGLDEFDALLLASQTSSKESPARLSRAAAAGGARDRRDSALGAGGGGAGSGAGDGAVMADACALDDDDSDDEFSLDPVRTRLKGRALPSSCGASGGAGDSGGGASRDSDKGGDEVCGVGAAAVAAMRQKVLGRKEATANKKRQRQEAVRRMFCDSLRCSAPRPASLPPAASPRSPSPSAFPLVERGLPAVLNGCIPLRCHIVLLSCYQHRQYVIFS